MREPVGLILAGGRGLRMGGVTKAEVTLGDQTLLDRCIARLSPQVSALAVNANGPIATSLPVLQDTMTGHLGPLAGVLAGLHWAEARGSSHVVTVAVDTPFFPCDLAPQLILASEAHGDRLAIAATQDGEHGTFGLWPVALRDALAGYLNEDGRKVRDFTTAQGAATAHFCDAQAFFNINTADDLAEATAWL